MANILTTQIQIFEGSGTDDLQHEETLTGSPASYEVVDLAAGQLYTMRARVTTDEQYTSDWSTVKTFTTMIDPYIGSLQADNGDIVLATGDIEYNPAFVTPVRMELLVSKNSGGSDYVAYAVDAVETWESGTFRIKDMDQNTTYYAVGRVVDSLDRTWTTPWNEAVSITTPYLPPVVTANLGEISYTSVTATAAVTSVAAVTMINVALKDVASGEIVDSLTLDNSKINGETQQFSFTGLTPDSQYQIVIEAKNSAGPATTNLDFTTLAQEQTTITISEFTDITPRSATANITYGSV